MILYSYKKYTTQKLQMKDGQICMNLNAPGVVQRLGQFRRLSLKRHV